MFVISDNLRANVLFPLPGQPMIMIFFISVYCITRIYASERRTVGVYRRKNAEERQAV